jgi:hypothetical protein
VRVIFRQSIVPTSRGYFVTESNTLVLWRLAREGCIKWLQEISMEALDRDWESLTDIQLGCLGCWLTIEYKEHNK